MRSTEHHIQLGFVQLNARLRRREAPSRRTHGTRSACPGAAMRERRGGCGRLLGRDARGGARGGRADDEAERAGGDFYRRAVGDAAFEDLLGQRVLQFALDHPL